MLRKLLIVGVSAGISASVPILYQTNPDLFGGMVESVLGGGSTDPEPVSAVPQLRLAPNEQPSLMGRKVLVAADARGHFAADFKMNGRTVTALVDTGATLVAINLSTARRLGIRIQPADFRYRVSTANGEISAASATIDTMQIGRIHLDDVQAVVLEDEALNGTLVGMSFLKRLGKYGVEDGTMLLVQ